MRALLLTASILVLTSCSLYPKPSSVHHEFFNHPIDASKRVEYFWAAPKTLGPWPVLLYIHGHQEPDRPGGRDMVDWGVLERMAEKGFLAVSISQPGYGQSDGPPDYCGPFTQTAVHALIDKIRTWQNVDTNKIALYGISRGAVVASMVEVQDSKLAAVVLVVGAYDMKALYKRLRKGDTELAKGMADNLRDETGATDQAFVDRSALLHADKIRVPTLILNGAKDERIDPKDPGIFAAKIRANGIDAKAVIFTDYGHSLPIEMRNKEIVPFLNKYLGSSL